MTIQATQPSISYAYSAVGNYSFLFKIFDTSDLLLQVTDSNGVVYQLVENTDYTATIDPSGTGGICALTYTSNYGTLEIRRELPQTQEVDLVNNDPLDMEILERAMDRLTALVQDVDYSLLIFSFSYQWRGGWAATTAYSVGNIAQYNDTIYICNTAHTSGSVFSNTNWAIFIDLTDHTHDADQVNYDNTASGMTATEVQAAIDELDGLLSSAMTYRGTHDASGGTAPSSVGASAGDYWVISAAGTISGTPYSVGDWIAWNGSAFERIERFFADVNRNLLLNTQFTVNRRAYAANGLAVLAADTYGHDMWMEAQSDTGFIYQKHGFAEIEMNFDAAVYLGIKQKNDMIFRESHGETCTISGEIVSGQLRFLGCGASPVTVTSTGKFNFSFTYDNTQNGGFISVLNNSLAANVRFKDLKFERGGRVTPYSPYRSDIEEDMLTAPYLVDQGYLPANSPLVISSGDRFNPILVPVAPRNRWINPVFAVNQIQNGYPDSVAYTINATQHLSDRTYTGCNFATNSFTSQVRRIDTTSPVMNGLSGYKEINCAITHTFGATDYAYMLKYDVYHYEIADLGASDWMILTFYMINNLPGWYNVVIQDPSKSYSYVKQFYYGTAGVVQAVAIPFQLDATYTPPVGIGKRLSIYIGAIGGSNFNASVGDTWEAGDYFNHPANAPVNWLNNTSNYARIGGFALREGIVEYPYVNYDREKSFAETLMECRQHVFAPGYGDLSTSGTFRSVLGHGWVDSASATTAYIYLKMPSVFAQSRGSQGFTTWTTNPSRFEQEGTKVTGYFTGLVNTTEMHSEHVLLQYTLNSPLTVGLPVFLTREATTSITLRLSKL